MLLTGIAIWLAIAAFSQTEIRGKITDEQGRPLPAAAIVLPETGEGAVADGQGFYFLKISKPGVFQIRVTYLGYEDIVRQATLQGTTTMDFSLRQTATMLNALTVKATRAGEKSPFTYFTIKKEELQNGNLGQDVPYLLDATPSVVVTSDAGAGIGYTGIRIRGSDPTRINVTINGIPVNDSESHNVFWVDLPDLAASAEDVQIQRGVGTSTNGAGAFGATINLNSGQLNSNPYGEIVGGAGSFGTWKSAVQFGSGLLRTGNPTGGDSGQSHTDNTGFTLDGRLSRIISDGYIDRAGVNLKSYYLSAAHFGKKSSLRANVFSGHEITYQAWNGVPAQWVDDPELRRFNVSGTEKSGTPYDNEVDDYAQSHYQLIYNWELNRQWHLNLTGHYTRGLGFFEQYKADQAPSRYLLPAPPCSDPAGGCRYDYVRRRWLDNHFFGGIGALHFDSDDGRWQAAFSGGWNRYLGDHYGHIVWGENLEGAEPNQPYYSGAGDKQDLNFFSKIHYNLSPRLHGFADLQYRQINYKITGTDNDLRETEVARIWHFFNPKAGLLWDMGEGTTAYASFAVANREPNRSDFTDAPEGFQPRPERLYNTEAGLRYRSRGRALGINFYQMSYRDQLVLTGNINDVGDPIRINTPESYRLGLELTGTAQLNSKLTVEANATLSQNKIRNFTEFMDNWDTGTQEAIAHGTTDIAFSPNLIAYARLQYEVFNFSKQQLTLALSGKYVGRQYIDNTSNKNTVLDAYAIGGLQVRWVLKPSFAEELSFNLLINNLFNARYSSNAWTYRYRSDDYDARPDDPYARLEGNGIYNLTGFFPQAGRNFLIGGTLRF